jgi:hypothetical protein
VGGFSADQGRPRRGGFEHGAWLVPYPVVLREGERPLANGIKPAVLGLSESKTTSAGVTVDVYEPAGEPTGLAAGTTECGGVADPS